MMKENTVNETVSAYASQETENAVVSSVEMIEETAEGENTATKNGKPRKAGKIRENRVFHIVNYTLLVLIILISLLPFVNVLAKSFSTYGKSVSLVPVNFTFYNYEFVFTNWPYFRSFFVSVGITVFGTLLSVGVMFSAAYALSKRDFPFRKGIMVFFLIVMLFSGGIVPNFFVIKMLGLLNTPFALIFPTVVQVFNLILLKNYLEGVPREIEESAQIDGASNLQTMIYILVPVALPSIASVALFTAVTYWNNYFSALIYLPNASKWWPLAMYMLNYIQSTPDVLGDQMLLQQKTYIEAAMIIVSIVPILAIYPFVTKYFVKGVTVGSVKG